MFVVDSSEYHGNYRVFFDLTTFFDSFSNSDSEVRPVLALTPSVTKVL